MFKYLIGAMLAGIMLATFAAPAAHADDSATPTFTVPHWGSSDVPPIKVAIHAIAWEKVVVRRFCFKTVTRTWERHGKGRWHLISKHVTWHHAPLEGCPRDQ